MSVVTNLKNFKSGCTLEKLRIATKITATEYIIYKLLMKNGMKKTQSIQRKGGKPNKKAQ